MAQELRYSRFSEVLQYAADKHAKQVRKGADIPYIVHPVAVAETLARYGAAEELVYAGLLHDVLEDTDTTREELAERYGTRVAQLVAAVSETKRDSSGKERFWDIRKAEQLAHLRHADMDVVQLKAADMLHNIISIRRDMRLVGENVWDRFKAVKEKQLVNYAQLAAALCQSLGGHPLGSELQTALEDLMAASGV